MANPFAAISRRTLAVVGGKAESLSDHRRAVHAACRRLGIDDEERRAIQLEVTGKASMTAMTPAEIGRLLDHLNRGYMPASAAIGGRAVAGKVRALWWTLYWLAAVDSPDARAIDAFVERQTGVAALRFLDERQSFAVIEALKAWAAREGVVWPVKPGPVADRRAVAEAIWRRLVQVAPIGNVGMARFAATGLDIDADPATWSARTWDEAIRFLGKRYRRERARK